MDFIIGLIGFVVMVCLFVVDSAITDDQLRKLDKDGKKTSNEAL